MDKQDLLNIAADVLEKAAAYIEAVESDKATTERNERLKIASTLKSRYVELTGEDVDDAILHKIAESGEDVVALFDKLAGSSLKADSMGGPSGVRDSSVLPQTKKEAAAVADDKFVTWLSNN